MDALSILWYLSFLSVLSSQRLTISKFGYTQSHYRFWANFVFLCAFDRLVIIKGSHDQKDMYRNIKIVVAILTEIVHEIFAKESGQLYVCGLAMLAMAGFFWSIEDCESHGVWHVLSAIGLGLIHLHYLFGKPEFN